jgi:hypothetical protein
MSLRPLVAALVVFTVALEAQAPTAAPAAQAAPQAAAAVPS